MNALLKIAKKEAPKKTQSGEFTPEDAMLELFDRTGAFDSPMTPRGSKLITGLLEKSVGGVKDGASQAIMQGKDFMPFLEPQARVKLQMKRRRLKPYDTNRLMMLVRQDAQLGRLAQRVLPQDTKGKK